MGMGGRPGRPRPARDAHQPLLVRRNYLLRPRGIAFPDEVMRSRVWPTLGLGYYVSQPFDPMAVSSHNPKPTFFYSLHSIYSLFTTLIPRVTPGYSSANQLGFIITCLTYHFPFILSFILGGSLLPLLIILHFHLFLSLFCPKFTL